MFNTGAVSFFSHSIVNTWIRRVWVSCKSVQWWKRNLCLLLFAQCLDGPLCDRCRPLASLKGFIEVRLWDRKYFDKFTPLPLTQTASGRRHFSMTNCPGWFAGAELTIGQHWLWYRCVLFFTRNASFSSRFLVIANNVVIVSCWCLASFFVASQQCC